MIWHLFLLLSTLASASLSGMDNSFLKDQKMPRLHRAALTGDMRVCEMSKADLYVTYNGMTALHYAAIGGNTKIASLFAALSNEIINDRDAFGNTALHLAVIHSGDKRSTISEVRGDVARVVKYGEVVEMLIMRGADVTAINLKGHSAITLAMKRCNIKIVDLLMKAASTEQWKIMIYKHMLCWVSAAEKTEKTEYSDNESPLIMRKRKVLTVANKSDARCDYDDFKMLLYCACLYNCVKLCSLLANDLCLIKRAQEEFDRGRLIDRKLMMLLHIAAELGYCYILKLLLPFYEVNDENNLFNRHTMFSSLHCAAVKGDKQAVELLCDHKIPIDVVDLLGYTPMLRAAQEGHAQIVDFLLERGANIHMTAEAFGMNDGLTALHIASAKGRVAVVLLLLQRGAALQSISADGLSPLHCAAFSGNAEVIRCFLREELAIRADGKGNIALHYAVKSGSVEAVEILCQAGHDVNVANFEGITPLHLACAQGLYPVVEVLLKSNADVHKPDSRGFMPIHFVCAAGRSKVKKQRMAEEESDATFVHKRDLDKDIQEESPYKKNSVIHELNRPVKTKRTDTQNNLIDLLIQYGSPDDLNAMTVDFWSPLLLAVSAEDKALVDFLILRGAKLHGTTNGYSLLHLALKQDGKECKRIVSTIMNLGRSYQVNLVENTYRTEQRESSGKLGYNRPSLFGHLAADADSCDILRMLLDLGVDVNLRDRDGWTILHRAVNKDSKGVVKLLLEFKADISVFSDDGYVPLHLAARACNVPIMKRLLEAPSADPDIASRSASLTLSSGIKMSLPAEILSSRSGYTALHLVTQFGSEDQNHYVEERIISAIKLLHSHKANLNCRTVTGVYPLHFASRNGYEKVVTMLIDLGASVLVKDRFENTPLDDAQRNGHQGVVAILKKKVEEERVHE